ncbi:MAG: hypothetical protein GY707_05600 [Desulfobacteraceae bacterium]|nr:hypothetical protein [Desulfobacteraceae bacterium]
MGNNTDFLLKNLLAFRPDHIDYLKVFKQLNGYFQGNILIGGSYAYSKTLELDWNGKDIDVFILIPRMESWALQNILRLVFDEVYVFDQEAKHNDNFMQNKANYYKIPGQWKRVIAYKNSMMYDLIFVDTFKDDLLDNTGSTISKLYYEITFNITNPLTLYYGANYLDTIKREKKCYIEMDQCTEAYASKIEKLCKQLNLELIYG